MKIETTVVLALLIFLAAMVICAYLFGQVQEQQAKRCTAIGKENSGQMRTIWQCPNGVEIL
jgi:hypothetical protein